MFDNPTEVRDTVLVFLAPLALCLAWWRTHLAARQTSLQQANNDMLQEAAFHDRFKASAELLEADKETTRLGAIWSLLALSKANPEAYQVRIMSLFASFLKYAPVLADGKTKNFKSADTLAIVQAINERTNEQKRIEIEQGFSLAARLEDTAFPMVGEKIALPNGHPAVL